MNRSKSILSSRKARAPLLPLRLTLSSTLLWTLAVLVCLATPGCSGCFDQDPLSKRRQEALEKKKQEQEDLKKRKKKPDFEIADPRIVTSDKTLAARALVKPGHWVTTTQQMRANNFDFQAELVASCVDRNQNPIDVEHTEYGIMMSRRAAFAKGKVKSIEETYFVPRRVRRDATIPWLRSELRAKRGGRLIESKMKPVTPMPEYQYYFLVISDDPDRYGYVKRLHSVAPPSDTLSVADNILFYQVTLTTAQRRVEVPSNPLAWTSVAYVLWDDLNPSVWTPDQRQALVDWLHWGGQIIVSGPGSLGRLKGSFLSDYLPAVEARQATLAPSAFDELNATYSPQEDGEPATIEFTPDAPPLGVEMEKHPEAVELPGTGGLIVERRVGRGRIVVTAFSMRDRQLINWPGFDGMFNACLLRRPQRRFDYNPNELMLYVRWNDYQAHTKDARLTTALRFFSRDIDDLEIDQSRSDAAPSDWEILNSGGGAGAGAMNMALNPLDSQSVDYRFPPQPPEHKNNWRFSGWRSRNQSGIAGWNDFSGAANAARASLRDAAGIEVPERDFVKWVLVGYLLVIAPLNWLVFRIIGRVEWAWVAAPMLAIVGAGVVIKMAQLDIGFARSRTEIAVLETQPDHVRGHLTRYSALYTSLSSSYALTFEDRMALALPFSSDPRYQRLPHQSASLASLRRDRGVVSLSDYTVASNSTGMTHSERMFPLGGSIRLEGSQEEGSRAVNDTKLTIKEAGVVARTDEGRLQAAWIGELAPGVSRPLSFQDVSADNDLYLQQWRQSPIMGEGREQEQLLRLRRMAELASQRLKLSPGDVRLIGWTDAKLGEMQIAPEATQQTFRTLVISHLKYGDLPPPEKDANHPNDTGYKEKERTLTDADIEGLEAPPDGKPF